MEQATHSEAITDEKGRVVAAPIEGAPSISTTPRVLIIERDTESVQMLRHRLRQAGFEVTVLAGGENAIAVIDREPPHLVMIDLDMPAALSVQIVRHVRRQSRGAIRLIALSTYAGEQHVVSGLEVGVDDYVVKPFAVGELVARVRALLRSTATTDDPKSDYLEFRELRMSAAEGRVMVRNGIVILRGIEFRLLEFLMRHPERAFTREALLLQVWGRDSRAETRAVDVAVQRVRRVLSHHHCDGYLQTIRGVGYRLSADIRNP
jgi:two-component system phosphate regulon response regulator PhoB